MINPLGRGRKISDALDLNSSLSTGSAPFDVLTDSALGEAAELPNDRATGSIGSIAATRAETSTTALALDVMPAPITSVPASSITIAEGDSAEIEGPGTQSVTFTGTTGTLVIDHSLGFTGQISGLAGSDALDLSDLSYGANTTATFLGTTTGGTLTVTDGSHTANIALTGNYLSSSWTLSSDGQGGTVVVDPVPANAWQTLKIGGGGVLSGISVAPDGTMVVRTDTYGAYVWNGSQWQQLVTSTSMPASIVTASNNAEGVYEIQVASSNSSIMYMMYLGDVFKTTDKGTTWILTSFSKVAEDPNDSYRTHGQKMAIDPNNPNVVYVGTPQNGLFVTTDGGATWQTVSAVPAALTDAGGGNPGITGIMFDPALGVTGGKTNTIFASSYGNGVYESTDAGTTWNHLSGSPSDVDYAAVSSDGAYYVAANNSSQLWRYMNGAWTELLSSYNYWVTSVAINPLNPLEIVVVGTNSIPNVSYDGGVTWTGFGGANQTNANDVPWLAETGGTRAYLGSDALVFNPLVPNQLITTGGTGVWNTILSQNWTASTPVVWNSQTAGIEQLCANQIIVPTSGHPVLASWDRAFFYVNDPNSYATTYGPLANTFAAGWSLDYASSNPNFVVGIADWWGTEESGYSTDGGQTWNLFPTMPAFAGKTIGGTIAASSPTDIVWAPADGFQPYYTTNGGASWSPVNLPGVTDWSGFDWAYYLNARTVTADRVLPNTFYMYYAGQGVYRSTDGGADWTQTFSGQISPMSYYTSELEAVPGEASNLFFTGGPTGDLTEPFMRSTDGGTTWTAVANVREVSVFGFGAPATPGGYPSIYIAGYVNRVYGIWQSNDNANSWIQIGDYPTGSLAGIRSITGDPNIYGQVYLGLSGDGFAYLPAAPVGTSVTGVAESPSTGDLHEGNKVTLTLNLGGAVTVAGGTPTLALNDGGTATYTGGSGTSALTFSYTVAAGQNTASLAATAINLNGATVQDGSGHAANFALTGLSQTGPQIDTTTPTIATITETPPNGALNAGKVVTYTITMSEVVTVNTTGGSPTLTLNDGGTGTYVSGSGSRALTFSYTVLAGQNTPDLMVSTFNLNGAAIADGAGNAANLSLSGIAQGSPQIDTTMPTVTQVVATPGSGIEMLGNTVALTLTFGEAVTVTGTPTLTLNDGGTATYMGGTGTNALTFSYTVASTDSTVSALAITQANLPNGATIKDGAGNAADLSGALTTFPSLGTNVLVDQAPVVAALNPTLTHNQSVAASSLFTASDPDGDTITSYALKDVTGNGHFVVNGVVQATNVEIDLTAAQLAQTTYQSGSGSDQLWVRASDGTLWSTWQSLIATAPVDQAPMVTAAYMTLARNQSVAASSLFTATDPDGDTIATYALKDVTGNGHFVVNGVVQATNVEIDLTAAQLAQTFYMAGSGNDVLSVRAFDGTLWSAWLQSFTVAAPLDQAPVVTTSNQWMLRNQTIAASSLFTVTDPDGDPITTYALKDPTGFGYFMVNGVRQASNTEIDLTAAQLAQTTYVSGSGNEQLSIRASDGVLWSAWQTASVTVAASNEKAPVVAASNLTTLAGQTIKASSLFAVSDPNGDPVLTYALKDVTGNGHFVVNGVVQATNTEIDLTAAQLAQTSFVAGSATDQLSVRASDGWLWSNWQAPAVNVLPTSVINAGATLELASAYSGPITFASTTGTLKLDNSASFAGTVAGMNGQDTLDFADINFATIGTPAFSGTSTGGTLTVTDGSHTANIALLGNYIASTFTVSSDGHGGTFVIDSPATSGTLGPQHHGR